MKRYNIAKRAKEWANSTRLLRVVDRKLIGIAVERLMREAYKEGIKAGKNE